MLEARAGGESDQVAEDLEEKGSLKYFKEESNIVGPTFHGVQPCIRG